jgi:predicted small lipoprotein YifL
MKQVTTAIAVVAVALLLAACGKKEEPAAAPEAAPAAAPEAAPADAAPADDNSEDAEQSGGDKVAP